MGKALENSAILWSQDLNELLHRCLQPTPEKELLLFLQFPCAGSLLTGALKLNQKLSRPSQIILQMANYASYLVLNHFAGLYMHSASVESRCDSRGLIGPGIDRKRCATEYMQRNGGRLQNSISLWTQAPGIS